MTPAATPAKAYSTRVTEHGERCGSTGTCGYGGDGMVGEGRRGSWGIAGHVRTLTGGGRGGVGSLVKGCWEPRRGWCRGEVFMGVAAKASVRRWLRTPGWAEVRRDDGWHRMGGRRCG